MILFFENPYLCNLRGHFCKNTLLQLFELDKANNFHNVKDQHHHHIDLNQDESKLNDGGGRGNLDVLGKSATWAQGAPCTRAYCAGS